MFRYIVVCRCLSLRYIVAVDIISFSFRYNVHKCLLSVDIILVSLSDILLTFRCHSFRYITPIDNTCRALRCNVHRCLYHSYIMPVDIILVSLRYSVGDFLSDKLPINGLSLIYIVRRCLHLRYNACRWDLSLSHLEIVSVVIIIVALSLR